MVNKLFLGLVLFLVLVMPVVVAVDVPLTVKYLPDHRISVNILRTGEAYHLIEAIHETTNVNGEIKIIFSAPYSEVMINTKVKTLEGALVIADDSGSHRTTEGEIVIDLSPASEEPEENDTEEVILEETGGNETGETTEEDTEEVVVEEEQEEATEETEPSTTGSLISESKDLFTNYSFYLIGFIFLVGLVGFFMMRKKGKMPGDKPEKEVKVKKLSEVGDKSSADLREIEDAERKIKEAQQEINRIKNHKHIEEAEKKLEADREALEKLKRGE
jgi:hypothetical protein